MALPTMATGKVVGQFLVGDGSTAAVQAAQGIVIFTAAVPTVPNPSGGFTLVNYEIVGVLDEEGWVCTPLKTDPTKPGTRGVNLAATDAAGVGVNEWTWTITSRFEALPGSRIVPHIIPFDFDVHAGQTEDLAKVAKVPNSTGTGNDYILVIARAEAKAAAGPAADAAVGAAILRADLMEGSDPRVAQNVTKPVTGSDPVYGVTDELGRRSWVEVGADGGPTDNSIEFLRPALSAPDSLPDFQKYAYSITDAQGRHSDITLGPDGRFAGFVIDRLAAAVGASYDALTKSDTSRLVTWGDSITEGGSAGRAWPSLLEDTLPATTTFNRGSSGETSGTIAVRQGGIILRVAACTIPAAAVPTETLAVTASVTPANLTNMPNILGTLAGVPGNLKRIGTDWTFTRTAAGAAVNVAAGTAFKPAFAQEHRSDVSIFWTGRNDAAFSWPTVVSGVVAATEAMVAHLSTALKRFLVVSVTTSSLEPAGSTGTRLDVLATNAALKAAFPNNYVDMRQHIMDNGLALAGVTPTAADRAAIANDTLPPSLLADGLHPNVLCRELVIAPKFRQELALRGWI